MILEPSCPCCGGPISPALALSSVPWFVGGTLAVVVRELAAAKGGPLSSAELADRVFRNADGGPKDGAGYVRQAIAIGRDRLALLGWRVDALPNQAGYVLRPLDGAAQ